MAPNHPPKLRVLGGVSAHGQDGPVDLGGPKQRAVLALVLAEPGVVVSLEQVIDRVWGHAPPARAEVSVRGYVSNLRKALVGIGLEPDALAFADGGYVLAVDPLEVDVHRVATLLDRAGELRRRGDLPGARAGFAEALDLHAGPAFGPTADALGLDVVASGVEERRAHAVEELTDLRLELGEHAQVPATLAGEIARHPYRERLRAQLALALYRSGRPVEALRSITEARRLLADDIGVEPGPELRSLEAAILGHDETLTWHPPVVTDSPTGAREAPTEPHFGRAREQQHIEELVDCLPDRGGVLVVSGEAGIGKSHLLRTLRHTAEHRGFPVAVDRCPESGAGAPYRSWTTILGTLLPTRAVEAQAWVASGDDDLGRLRGDQVRQLDLLRAIGAPVVIIVDDLQWADDATLSLLGFVAPELEHLRILLAVGVRRAGAGELSVPVEDCLVELARTGAAVHLSLDGLDPAAVVDWLHSADHDADIDPAFGDHLVETTGGNPFFLREVLALLAADGRLDRPFDPTAPTSVPAAAHDVIRRRTSRLPPDTQALLAVAAVVGRRFAIDVLADVVELDLVATLARLGPAIAAGLVEREERAVGDYAFSHALVASALAAEQSPDRLAAWHARTVDAIERRRAGDLEPWVEDLAHHATEGLLAGTAPKAFTYALEAATAAESARSFNDAAIQLRHALAAATLLPEVTLAERRSVLLRLGLALRAGGDLAGRPTLVDAARLAEADGDVTALAEILGNLDDDSLWAGYDWNRFDERLIGQVTRAQKRTDLDDRARVQLTAALAGELVYLDSERSTALFGEAAALASPLDDPLLAARVLLRWFWSVSGPTGLAARAEIGDRLVELETRGSLPARLRPLAHLACVSAALERGEVDAARQSVDRARELAHPVRTPTAWAHLQWAEAGLALLDDDLQRARVHGAALRPALHLVRRYTADSSPAVVEAVIAAEDDRPDDALRSLAVFTGTPYAGPIRWLDAWVLAKCGRSDEARDALAAFDGPLPDDWLQVPILTAAILAAAAIEADAFLRRHLPVLEPWDGRLAFVGEGGPFLGPTGFAVAAGRACLGDHDGAQTAGAAALALAERAGAVRWVPHVEALLAKLPD